jgi:alpha-galactosidase
MSTPPGAPGDNRPSQLSESSSARSERPQAAPPPARHALAGRLEPLRVGVRVATSPGSTGALAPETRDEFAADGLAPGRRRLGDVELAIARADHRDAATFDLEIRNAGSRPIQLESVVLGFRWTRFAPGALRFLRHGWQSWSFTGPRDLDAAGTPAFPSGEWLRGMHHGVGRPPADRIGWHESDGVSAVASAGGGACVAGVLETGRTFGQVYLRREPASGAVRVEVEQRLEVVLEPGEARPLDAVRVAIGGDAHRLLEHFASLWGRRADARTRAPFQSGWCSWYHFFHAVTEDDVLRNLEALAAERGDLPVSVVQLDDGYQRAIGDWLETNEKFPRGLAPLAADIRSAGFRAGIWTAPFCAVTEARIHEDHRDWLLRDGDELFNGLLHPEWSAAARVFALDPTRPEVVRHLETVFGELVGMGFEYLKLDFLHAVAMRADAADPRVSRAERLARGLDAVRRGAGNDAFLLGCGCPLGPAVGRVDAMRIGPDVAPTWEARPEMRIPGLEPVLPSTASAIRNVVNRAWMHRRLWLNDPDCLMARAEQTELSAAEIRHLASAIAVTGGMLLFSDDMKHVSQEGREWIRETGAWAGVVDAAAPEGAVRIPDLLSPGPLRPVVADLGPAALVAAMNGSDEAHEAEIDLASLRLSPEPEKVEALLDSPVAQVGGGRVRARLGSRESGLYHLEGARSLAVFCDFDGTFSVQDVGATLAKQRLPGRRAELWARFEAGDFTPWEYNIELLDGFALPREELAAFLRTIDLDPGARSLVDWCRSQDVPFRVLSDGFDHNLDFLQAHHGVRFEYASNHLRYEGDLWRLAPGGPNPSCGCGTGTCKRAQISAWRAAHPGAFCVHVGNGRVSDLCGAAEADLAFAKDTLAPALAERGVSYRPFHTLDDVLEVLGARWGASA